MSPIQDIYNSFRKDCPSGHLSPQKFTELYEAVFDSKQADAFREKAFGQFDKHNNGTINFRDFLMVVHMTRETKKKRVKLDSRGLCSNGSAEDKLRTMFTLYDKDGNGSIDAAEMER